MTDKLKTLKDIENEHSEHEGSVDDGSSGIICSELTNDLRSEAIRWIKLFKRCIEDGITMSEFYDNQLDDFVDSWTMAEDGSSIRADMSKIDFTEFMKHFFNLTEEEMK